MEMRMSTAAQPVTYGNDPALFRWSVARYQRMFEVGVLPLEDEVELLEDHIVLRTLETPSHGGAVDLTTVTLTALTPSGWLFRVRRPFVLQNSQPEPDFAVVRGSAADYETRHPGPADVGLIIEVADTSLLRDQRDKTRIYARAGIPVYWILNLVDRRVELYTQPSGPTAAPDYAAPQVYQPGDAVPLALDGAVVGTVPAADLLP